MSTEITIRISDQVFRHARRVADQSHQRLEEVVAAWLERVLLEAPVEELSDEELLALTELQLTTEQQDALSDLLERNREDKLDAEGRQQLDALMHRYEQGLLRKSQALSEAVVRGLREPLQP